MDDELRNMIRALMDRQPLPELELLSPQERIDEGFEEFPTPQERIDRGFQQLPTPQIQPANQVPEYPANKQAPGYHGRNLTVRLG